MVVSQPFICVERLGVHRCRGARKGAMTIPAATVIATTIDDDERMTAPAPAACAGEPAGEDQEQRHRP